MSKIVQFKTIQLSISTQFKCKYSLIVKCKYSVLLKTVQFSISTQFNCQKHLFQTIQVIICNNSVKCKYNFNVEKQFYLK